MSQPLVFRCDNCGANNRVALEKLQPGKQPICARCKQPLNLRPHPFAVTDATFADEVEQSPLPVLIDMWAPWCGPCHMLAPVVEALSVELAGRLRVAKLNIDDNPAVADRFHIQSIPALLVFKDGREIDRITGVRPKPEILSRVSPLIAS